ncbi:MAG: InlB B-repeat-containing protein [Acetivibrionales bacterium]
MDSGASTVGGIVGFGYEGVIKNCRASGTLSGTENTGVGGIVGYIYSTYTAVLNCHTRVNAISGSSAGGVVGIAVADIINCYAAGYVEGTYFEGALVGRAPDSELINCYWNSDLESNPVDGGGYAGALGLPADVMNGSEAPADPIVYNTAAGSAEASGNDAFLSALNGGRSAAGDVHSGISAFPWRSDIFDENGGFPVLAMPAPELNLTISPGTVVGTTSVTAPAGDGNHLAYMLTDAPTETPYKNEAVGGVIDYVSGNNITVSAGQYLNVYELNAGSQVIAFKSIQIELSNICGDIVTISDEAELRAFAADVNVGNSYSGKTVVLTNDIALTEEWTPIGTVDHPFEGVFDGSGYTVSGLFIGSSESPDTTNTAAGLFGLCSQASIKNVIVRVEIFSNNENPACSIGALVGYSQGGSIQNCRAEGSITCYNGMFGGIVGTKTNSLVQNCSASVNVTCGDGTSYAGGLVGFNAGNILNCYATGSVTGGNSTYIGGVAGANSYGTIRDCYAISDLKTGNGGIIGGIAAGNSGEISNSFSACEIIVLSGAAGYAGALVGYVVDQPDIIIATVDSSYYNSDLNDDLPGIGYNLGSGTVTVTGLTTAEMQGTDALSAGHMSELGANWEVTPGYYPHLKALAVRLTFKEQDDTTLATIDFNPGARLTPPDVGERLGFTFDGWFTSDGQEIDFTQPVLLTADTVLTAGWTADTYTLTFDADDVDVSPESKSVTFGEEVGELPEPEKDGYEFHGWYTQPNGLGTQYTSATIYQVSANTTLYAYWAKLFNVSYNLNGGTGTPPAQFIKAADSTFTAASADDLTAPSGKRFKEWNTSFDGSGTGYLEGDTVTMPAYDLTLYAIWEDNNAVISPDSAGFDKFVPADIQTTVTWGDATGITDVKAGGVSIGAGNYTVSGSTLTIKKEYLAAQSTGDLILNIEFNAGAPAALTIAISDTKPPSVSPAQHIYDLSNPGNLTSAIIWNSADSVTGVAYSGSDLTEPDDFVITGSDLTIKENYLSGLSLTTGDAIEFVITFNTSDTTTLTVNVDDNYMPGNNADLSSLSVNGTAVSDFRSDVTEYNVELPYGSAVATVTAATADPYAKYVVTPALSLPGTAAVTVTAENRTTLKTYTVNLTIGTAPDVLVTNISVNGENGVESVQVGSTLQMIADVTPANASNRNITWSIADGSGAEIETNGLLTGTAAGTVIVRAAAQDGSNVYGEKEITITADPNATCTVTFISRGSMYAVKTVNAGESIGNAEWPANPTRSGYTFGGWFTGENGTGTRFTSATAVNSTMAVYAKWTYKGGSSDDGSSGGPEEPDVPAYNADINEGDGNKATIPIAVDNNAGTASTEPDSQDLAQGGNVIVTMPSIPSVTNYTVGVPAESLSTPNGGTLTLNTDTGSITLPSNMLSGIADAEGKQAQISIGQGDKSSLSDDIREAIGDRPLISLTLTLDGQQTDWNNPDAPVTVSIPYTPTAAELANPESIVVWYIDGSGNAVCVPNGRYDPDTGTVTFLTTHFSYYAVSFKQVSFKDVGKNAWYARAVFFIAAREITAGTGNGNFSPEAKLTRGQFVVMLMKAYGIAPDMDPKDNFADAGNTYYTGYLAAAKRLGISAGVGSNQFAPEREITRQEMFTMLYNALKAIGKLPQGDSGKTLSSFSDAGDIAPWAKDAIKLLVETGAVSGSGSRLSPKDTANRAQMAQMLYSLLGG